MVFFTSVLNEGIQLHHVPGSLLAIVLKHCSHADTGAGMQCAPTASFICYKFCWCKLCSNFQGKTHHHLHISHTHHLA